jgi:uncharacterized protein YxeA
MKKIIKNICILVLMLIGCISCQHHNKYTIRDNKFIVVSEEKYKDKFSVYTLEFNNTVIDGFGSKRTHITLIYDSDAFEVHDKVKIVKIN